MEKDYLHGYCNEWVVDNFKNGDKILAFIEYDYDIESCTLLHVCLYRNGLYLDVRGYMQTEEDVLNDFDEGEYVILSFNNIKDFDNLYNNLVQLDPEDIGLL